MKARNRRRNSAEPRAAYSCVSSWLGSPPESPAAKLVTRLTATHREAVQARENHLRHGRHADEIGAEQLGHADLGRRLERRAVEPHVDALA